METKTPGFVTHARSVNATDAAPFACGGTPLPARVSSPDLGLVDCLDCLRALARAVSFIEAVDLVFDGPPGPEGARFIEADRLDGTSVNVGEWKEIPATGGWWRLRVRVAL